MRHVPRRDLRDFWQLFMRNRDDFALISLLLRGGERGHLYKWHLVQDLGAPNVDLVVRPFSPIGASDRSSPGLALASSG